MVDPGSIGRCYTQALETVFTLLVIAERSPRRRSECRWLQERKTVRQQPRTEDSVRNLDGGLFTSHRARRGEELGDVATHRIRSGTRARELEVGEDDPVGTDDDVVGVESAVRDTGLMHEHGLAPETLEELLITVLRRKVAETDTVRRHRDEQGRLRPCGGRDDHRWHPNSGRLGPDLRVGLVLDLFQAGERDRRARITVRDEPPALCEEAGVALVATDRLDRHRAVRGCLRDEQRVSGRLSGGEGDRVRRDTQLVECGLNVRAGWTATR